jgi:hypothetical protein
MMCFLCWGWCTILCPSRSVLFSLKLFLVMHKRCLRLWMWELQYKRGKWLEKCVPWGVPRSSWPTFDGPSWLLGGCNFHSWPFFPGTQCPFLRSPSGSIPLLQGCPWGTCGSILWSVSALNPSA